MSVVLQDGLDSPENVTETAAAAAPLKTRKVLKPSKKTFRVPLTISGGFHTRSMSVEERKVPLHPS